MKLVLKYRFAIALFIVVACSFVLMVWASANTSLWNDEFATIDSLRVDQSFSAFITSEVTNGFTGVNFFHLVARMWFQIVPFGDNWLLLLSNLASCVALVFTGLAGRLLKGPVAGIVSCVFLATSHAMIIYCATEFRFYGFTLMFASMVMYFYIKRNQSYPDIKISNTIFFGVVMGLLVNVQLLAAPVLIAPFICDCILFVRRRISIKSFLPYLIACLFVFPGYFIRIFMGGGASGSLWNPNMDPSIANAIRLVSGELLDGSQLRLFFYILGVAVAIVLVIRAIIYKASPQRRSSLLITVITCTPLVNIALLLLLSRTVEGYMIFMTRYISWTLPFIAVASAFGILWLLEQVKPQGVNRIVPAAICCVLFFYLLQIDIVKIDENPGTDHYQKEVVTWISEHEEVYAPDACVVWADWWVKGIKDYYFDKQGIPAPENMLGLQETFVANGTFGADGMDRVYYVITIADMNDEMNAAWEWLGYTKTETISIEWIPRIHVWEK